MYIFYHKPAASARDEGDKKGMVSRAKTDAETIPQDFYISGMIIFSP
jgi:hypothetical protein